MARKKTNRNKTKIKKIKFASKFSRGMIIIFALVFANIGAFSLILTQAETASGYYESVEFDQFYRINSARSSAGAKSLARSRCLTDIARNWAKYMADKDIVAHSDAGGSAYYYAHQINVRCSGGTWSGAGENVSTWPMGVTVIETSGDTFAGYMNSTGHRENILNRSWDFVGIGAYVKNNVLKTAHVFADCNGCGGSWSRTPTKVGDPAAPVAPTPTRNEKDQINSTHGDFNGDGFDDIFWYGPGSVADSVWYGTSTVGKFTIHNDINVSGANYVPLVGDFNGDGRSDIFWYGPGGTGDYMWYGGSSRGSFSSTSNISVSGTFEPVVGDYNGDGRDDVFWYAAGSASDFMWYFNSGSASYTSHVVSVSGDYTPVPGDYNGDGRGDIFWYAPGKTTDYIWYFNSSKTSYTSHTKAVNVSSYEPVPGDFNGDGRGDIFWYAPGSTGDYIWYGNSTKASFSSYSKSINGIYNGIPGDFNGDGRGDIFWYGPTGGDYLWSGNTTKGSFSSTSAVDVLGSDYLPSP